jgi:branched-chain amino acid transport system substrate-binding protein
MEPQVTGASEWHINADEPTIIDYDEDYNPDGYYSSDEYRASDHDPIIVGLHLTEYPYRTYLPLATKNYPQTFKLGILGPFSGPQYRVGDDFERAVNMAFDAIGWSIGGYRIEPVWIDSESDPGKAADNYEEAILQDGVQAGLLNWHSSVAVSCMEVVADYQVPHFAGFGAADTINLTFNSDRETFGYWTTKWWPDPGKLNVSYVEMLEDAIGSGGWSPAAKTVVISGEDTDWGHAFGDAIKGNFQAAGWSVLGEAYFSPGQTDFSAALALLSTLNPAVVAGSSYSAMSVAALLNQAHAAGLGSVIVADGLGWMGDWYSETGDASNHVLDQMPPGWLTAEAQAFADAYQARYGTSPDPTSVGLSYDAANFFIAAAEATYQESGELSSEALYEFVHDELWTGQWSFTDGIMMPEYKYTEETIPDPVVGDGHYIFPVLQYFDGEGKIVFPPDWADQPFTPPGS